MQNDQEGLWRGTRVNIKKRVRTILNMRWFFHLINLTKPSDFKYYKG